MPWRYLSSNSSLWQSFVSLFSSTLLFHFIILASLPYSSLRLPFAWLLLLLLLLLLHPPRTTHSKHSVFRCFPSLPVYVLGGRTGAKGENCLCISSSSRRSSCCPQSQVHFFSAALSHCRCRLVSGRHQLGFMKIFMKYSPNIFDVFASVTPQWVSVVSFSNSSSSSSSSVASNRIIQSEIRIFVLMNYPIRRGNHSIVWNHQVHYFFVFKDFFILSSFWFPPEFQHPNPFAVPCRAVPTPFLTNYSLSAHLSLKSLHKTYM